MGDLKRPQMTSNNLESPQMALQDFFEQTGHGHLLMARLVMVSQVMNIYEAPNFEAKSQPLNCSDVLDERN